MELLLSEDTLKLLADGVTSDNDTRVCEATRVLSSVVKKAPAHVAGGDSQHSDLKDTPLLITL